MFEGTEGFKYCFDRRRRVVCRARQGTKGIRVASGMLGLERRNDLRSLAR